MLSLHTNAASLSTQNALGVTQKGLTKSMTALGTGYRVNSAMDDAAGLQIATRLNAQLRGMAVAQRNTQNGISMMQTAEGSLNEMTNIVLRMKDLATEAFTASTTTPDKAALQAEYDALGRELNNIFRNTAFGGQQLFSDGSTTDGSLGMLSGSITFQIGSSMEETMDIDFGTLVSDLATRLDAIAATYTDPTTDGTEMSAAANTILGTLNTALDDIGNLRSALGATSNRLDHVFNNLGNMMTSAAAAKGRIMDVNYATETANMTTKQMLMQASTSMLKQSNSMSQLTLSLLQ